MVGFSVREYDRLPLFQNRHIVAANMATSPAVASTAGSELANPATPSAVRSVDASALSQAKRRRKGKRANARKHH
jgi:hypothetical protein